MTICAMTMLHPPALICVPPTENGLPPNALPALLERLSIQSQKMPQPIPGLSIG